MKKTYILYRVRDEILFCSTVGRKSKHQSLSTIFVTREASELGWDGSLKCRGCPPTHSFTRALFSVGPMHQPPTICVPPSRNWGEWHSSQIAQKVFLSDFFLAVHGATKSVANLQKNPTVKIKPLISQMLLSWSGRCVPLPMVVMLTIHANKSCYPFLNSHPLEPFFPRIKGH